ncbi:glycosyltransferase [Paenibacillus sp.]|uniref:glycosyltransferase n=1 Tax=Paenibacillus sp. TaxID=58172 RepID=UPI0028A70BF9|nr:glycosyltransferase [Paenibacillus sp.]
MIELGALHFSGNETITFQKSIWELFDTFTYEFWVKAEAEQTLGFEQENGTDGITGKRYLIYPDFRFPGNAGFGISVGTNGISIHEHSSDYMPAKLVYPYSFSDWQHVAVVYENKTPSLYINGEFVKKGLSSEYNHVYPSLTVGGHPYGHFVGKVAHLRLWSTARTLVDIQNFMFEDLLGHESGLYWHWNPLSGTLVANSTKKNIQVSVIMPSHNRFPLNHFALRALESQTYPADQMEVIFLDDGSTDSTTSLLDNYLNPRFPIKFVRLEKAVGRGKIRNIGMSLSSGSVLLFLDAEMLCPPDLIEKHMLHHQEGNPLVVSGSMKVKRIFTVADPQYTENQISHMQSLYQLHPSVQAMITQFHVDRTAIQLLPMEAMSDPTQLDPWSFEYDYFEKILTKHGPYFNNFHYSWLNFITSNVSLPKSLLEKSGYFNEQFEGYGWEDWELGFRLYKEGAYFIHDDEVINYHQEHPRPADNFDQSRKNFMKFVQLHPGPEIQLIVLDMIPHRREMVVINEYLTDILRLQAIYTEKFNVFYQFILYVLEKLCYMLSLSADIFMPLPDNILDTNIMKTAESKLEAEEIRKLNTFPRLMELYDLLYDFVTKEES